MKKKVFKNSLLAFSEDIKNRSVWDWIKAHTSFMRPLHRYRGTVKLTDKDLKFKGRDIKDKSSFQLKIPITDIKDVNLGFDKVFSGWEERAAPWNKPLRIKYNKGGEERTIYIFARFHRKFGLRSSDNKKLLNDLGTLWG